MLRGPQTPGELKGRTDRIYRFASLEHVEAGLERLIDRELVARLPRRPGQKEERFTQLLGGEAPETVVVDAPVAAVDVGGGRVAELEARVERLEEEVASLRTALDGLRGQIGRAHV